LKLTLLANYNSRIDGVEIPSSAVQKTQAIADKIEQTVSFMSWSLAVLCILFLFVALTLPAQKPLYSAQNNLPRILSGQIAGGLVSSNEVLFLCLFLCLLVLFQTQWLPLFLLAALLTDCFGLAFRKQLHCPIRGILGRPPSWRHNEDFAGRSRSIICNSAKQ
jgi:hypothetical protein